MKNGNFKKIGKKVFGSGLVDRIGRSSDKNFYPRLNLRYSYPLCKKILINLQIWGSHLNKAHICGLVLVQPRKTGNCPDMTEKLLTGT